MTVKDYCKTDLKAAYRITTAQKHSLYIRRCFSGWFLHSTLRPQHSSRFFNTHQTPACLVIPISLYSSDRQHHPPLTHGCLAVVQASWVPKNSTKPKLHLQLNSPLGLLEKPSLPACHAIPASHAHRQQQRQGTELGLSSSAPAKRQRRLGDSVSAGHLGPAPAPGTASRAAGAPGTLRPCVRTARARGVPASRLRGQRNPEQHSKPRRRPSPPPGQHPAQHRPALYARRSIRARPLVARAGRGHLPSVAAAGGPIRVTPRRPASLRAASAPRPPAPLPALAPPGGSPARNPATSGPALPGSLRETEAGAVSCSD